MPKKSSKSVTNPELAEAVKLVESIKFEIAEALAVRNSLPASATDAEKHVAAARVNQLQADHHEAVQKVMAIKRDETAKLERDHKEKKRRHKVLKASRHGGGTATSHDDIEQHPRSGSIGRFVDPIAEEAHLDAANEDDLRLERQRLEVEDKESAEEVAHLRRLADKKRRKEEDAKLREARTREKAEARAKREAERLAAEKKARAKSRQQAALDRDQQAKVLKRKQRAARDARNHALQAANRAGPVARILQKLKSIFGGRE